MIQRSNAGKCSLKWNSGSGSLCCVNCERDAVTSTNLELFVSYGWPPMCRSDCYVFSVTMYQGGKIETKSDPSMAGRCFFEVTMKYWVSHLRVSKTPIPIGVP